MDQLETDRPNAEQIEFWNVAQGDKWVRLEARTDATLAPVGQAAIARLAPAPGERVLDVGCGCGWTSLEIARRVAPDGAVTGIDISRPMLARARARARAANAPIAFIEADAQVHDFAALPFDAVFSRLGVMFFEAPEAAFANLRAATRPGGRLALAVWRDRADNPWTMTTVNIARPHVELPPRPGPEEPGQFSFADEARVRRILETAGWAEIEIERFDTQVTVGRDPEDAAAFLVQMGPAGLALAAADEATRELVSEELVAALAPFAAPDGVHMAASAWIIGARRK